MNFLAHAHLAGERGGDRLGAIMGDFVKGPLNGRYPLPIEQGIALHRHIDSYTDAHPVFVRSRRRIAPSRRRYAGILIDLFYDHFLARHWSQFHTDSLPGFSRQYYRLLHQSRAEFPGRLAELVPIMAQQDWLGGYRSIDGIAHTLERMSTRRLSRPNPLARGIEDLRQHYDALEQDFFMFFPDIVVHVEPRLRERESIRFLRIGKSATTRGDGCAKIGQKRLL